MKLKPFMIISLSGTLFLTTMSMTACIDAGMEMAAFDTFFAVCNAMIFGGYIGSMLR